MTDGQPQILKAHTSTMCSGELKIFIKILILIYNCKALFDTFRALDMLKDFICVGFLKQYLLAVTAITIPNKPHTSLPRPLKSYKIALNKSPSV